MSTTAHTMKTIASQTSSDGLTAEDLADRGRCST